MGTSRRRWVPPEGRGYLPTAVRTSRRPWVSPDGRGYLPTAVGISRDLISYKVSGTSKHNYIGQVRACVLEYRGGGCKNEVGFPCAQ